ncbi:class I SAM-dependent methyltransferase [Nostocales cyanobacterium LEGE 11386]|nr:class I SAM-dependent methyltransferase [Nostocales cyanobacterium LEGE 11386]
MAEKNTNFNLPKEVLFYGRTLPEYLKMFDLDLSIWKDGKVLDCPAGPASFVEEARQRGLDVVGCDPAYTDELQLIINKGNLDIDETIKFSSQYLQLFSQKFYVSLEDMRQYAKLALRSFVDSYIMGKQQKYYIQASLPNLPFSNQSFDLVLSGNFLFIYSDLSNKNLQSFDYQFHKKAVLELLRVCKKEVRIFPVPCIQGELHKYVKNLLADLETQELVVELTPVEYEVFKGGNLMLRLIKRINC